MSFMYGKYWKQATNMKEKCEHDKKVWYVRAIFYTTFSWFPHSNNHASDIDPKRIRALKTERQLGRFCILTKSCMITIAIQKC